MTDRAEERDRGVEIFTGETGSDKKTLSAHHISKKTADSSQKACCSEESEEENKNLAAGVRGKTHSFQLQRQEGGAVETKGRQREAGWDFGSLKVSRRTYSRCHYTDMDRWSTKIWTLFLPKIRAAEQDEGPFGSIKHPLSETQGCVWVLW